MLRRFVLPIACLSILLASPVLAQNRVDDPPDPAEVLEDMLKGAYYSGAGRAQRPIVDRVPEQILSGTGFYFTNVRYFKGVGKILTDLNDHTIYATRLDSVYGKSSLSSDDLGTWQPIQIEEDTKLTGLWGKAWNDSLEIWILTLVDKPLYRFVGDKAPGQVNGRNSNWYPMEVIG